MKASKMRLFLVFLMTLFVNSIFAQQNSDDPVLMTISGEKITKSEFLSVYFKNNIKKESIDQKSLEEYLDLYVNFKLKVKEAEALGMDTIPSFKSELAGYRKQLSAPYLMDTLINEKILQEAYDRMQWDIHASHILIKVAENALPADTLKAYNKIMAIRKRIVEKGEDFGKVAMEVSEDPSAKNQEATGNRQAVKGNAGDIGYFTVFDLIYPFETAAYNTKVGQISMPVRTDYGYHLVKVTDRKPAMGKVQIAHILVSTNQKNTPADSLNSKAKIQEIYTKLKQGASFEDLAKQYSHDKGSAAKGGVLPWFGVNRMVAEFVPTVSSLKTKGDISEPIQTTYGWHILKLIDRKGIASFDSVKTELKSKMAKDSRSAKSKQAMVDKIKKEYGFKEDLKAVKDFYKLVNDSIFMGKWSVDKAKGLNKTVFSLGDKSYNQQDFAKFLSTHQLSKTKEDSSVYINKVYKLFVEENVIKFEDSKLEAKFPKFRALMKEYRDGILLFELTDEKVWSKAVKDTTGLKEFYEKNKANYMWEDRVDADIYSCANEKVAAAARKLVKKGKLSTDEILALINKDSQLNLKIESGKYLKKENAAIDSVAWVSGLSKNIKIDKMIVFVKINRVLAKQPKSLDEAKGLITADYQSFLEKEWIAQLKKKYAVEINKEVFSTIK